MELELINRVRSGDEEAFTGLVQHYYPELFAFATRHLRGSSNPDGANDVLQGVFLNVWRRRGTLASDIPLRAYLYRAVRNALANQRRDSAREEGALGRARDIGEFTPQFSASAGDNLELTETAGAIERAVQALPARCREVWILIRERGLSYSDAAQALGISVGTVRTQMTRAFASIRKAAEPYL